jgi:hypothetical protein
MTALLFFIWMTLIAGVMAINDNLMKIIRAIERLEK